METENTKLILDYLDKIAAKLGLTVEQVWPWLVRQEYIEAVFSTVIFALITAASVKLFVFVGKHWRPNGEGAYSIYNNDHEAPWIIALIVFAVLFVASFFICAGELPGAFNPEYGALQELIRLAKQ